MKAQDNLIHPEDSVNLSYWTRKWRVSVSELNDAILYTGSLNPAKVKGYLRREVWYHLPYFGLGKLFKSREEDIH